VATCVVWLEGELEDEESVVCHDIDEFVSRKGGVARA
jgi:hypothetical protein